MLVNIIIFAIILTLAGILLFWKSALNKVQISYALVISITIFITAMLLSLLWRQYFAHQLPTALLSAILEEISRFIVFKLLLIHYKIFTNHHQRLKVSIISGTVFTLLENSGYIVIMSPLVFIVRFLSILPLHLFLSALQIEYHKKGLLIAIILHSLYNLTYSTNYLMLHIIAQIFAISSVAWPWWWLKRSQQKYFHVF